MTRSPKCTSASSGSRLAWVTLTASLPKALRKKPCNLRNSTLSNISSPAGGQPHDRPASRHCQKTEEAASPSIERRLLGQDLVHIAGGLGATGLADDAGGNAGDRLVVRHIMQDDGARGNPRAAADFDIAEDFGAGADEHAAPDLWMAVASFLAGAAERHA